MVVAASFIYFHDFVSVDGCDLDLKTWGTAKINSLFLCVKNTILVAYTFWTIKIFYLCQVHVTSKSECQTPFGIGIASDPMAFRRGGKKLAMEDVCYYQWPLPGIPQVFLSIDCFLFFSLFLRRDANLFVRKAKWSKFLLAVWSVWYLWWTWWSSCCKIC